MKYILIIIVISHDGYEAQQVRSIEFNKLKSCELVRDHQRLVLKRELNKSLYIDIECFPKGIR